MIKQILSYSIKYVLTGITTSLFLFGCDQEITSTSTIERETSITPEVAESAEPIPDSTKIESSIDDSRSLQTQFNVGNKSYLFDVSDHNIEELEALLERAEEITQASSEEYADLEIVMILHGPDIDWFTQQNYEKNKKLVDLAARLDTYDIIDMKVCETAMSSRGVNRNDIPAFIESVPYAPDEMKRLFKEGYINL